LPARGGIDEIIMRHVRSEIEARGLPPTLTHAAADASTRIPHAVSRPGQRRPGSASRSGVRYSKKFCISNTSAQAQTGVACASFSATMSRLSRSQR
jgi:hypothetical protein